MKFYKSLIDKHNIEAQTDYEDYMLTRFYVKEEYGPGYRAEYRQKKKPDNSILGILKDVFINQNY